MKIEIKTVINSINNNEGNLCVDIFKRNNWFQLMGSCYKMMTVTFWAAHGARQSNHQDDFGSSKWQVQVYGRKQWIMHPPEQSSYLYVVVSYCFFFVLALKDMIYDFNCTNI